MTDIEGRYSSQECDSQEGRAAGMQRGPLAYICLDTETNGLMRWDRPADAEGQCRMASIAMISCDAELNPFDTYHTLIRPEGWVFDDNGGAAKVNGLTHARLCADGHPIAEVLDLYEAAIAAGAVVVTFNTQFDLKVIRGERRRAGRPDLYLETRSICPMRTLTEICRIPSRSGRGWKWPSLSEACVHFGIEQGDAHGALLDALACLKVSQVMMKRGLWPEPHVPKSKREE